MAKFTKLTIGDTVASSGEKCFKRLSAEETPSVSLITFTIDGTSYQAEEGMTWAEWYESEYNTSSYYIDDLEPALPNGYYITDINATDTIVQNGAYEVEYKTHAGGAN